MSTQAKCPKNRKEKCHKNVGFVVTANSATLVPSSLIEGGGTNLTSSFTVTFTNNGKCTVKDLVLTDTVSLTEGTLTDLTVTPGITAGNVATFPSVSILAPNESHSFTYALTGVVKPSIKTQLVQKFQLVYKNKGSKKNRKVCSELETLLVLNECKPIIIRQSDLDQNNGYTIPSSGVYELCSNIVFLPSDPEKVAITIGVSNVTLYFKGYVLSQGNNTLNTIGVHIIGVGINNIVVHGGTVQDFTYPGIIIEGPAYEDVSLVKIANMVFKNNSNRFLSFSAPKYESSSLYIYQSKLVIVEDCQVLGNVGSGIKTSKSNQLVFNRIQIRDITGVESFFGATLAMALGCALLQNVQNDIRMNEVNIHGVFAEIPWGIVLHSGLQEPNFFPDPSVSSPGLLIENCTVRTIYGNNNPLGILVFAWDGAVVRNCEVADLNLIKGGPTPDHPSGIEIGGNGVLVENCAVSDIKNEGGVSLTKTFTGSIAGDILTVTTVPVGGTLFIGNAITGAGVAPDTIIIANNGTGNGGIGTYMIKPSQVVASTSMVATPVPLFLCGFCTASDAKNVTFKNCKVSDVVSETGPTAGFILTKPDLYYSTLANLLDGCQATSITCGNGLDGCGFVLANEIGTTITNCISTQNNVGIRVLNLDHVMYQIPPFGFFPQGAPSKNGTIFNNFIANNTFSGIEDTTSGPASYYVKANIPSALSNQLINIDTTNIQVGDSIWDDIGPNGFAASPLRFIPAGTTVLAVGVNTVTLSNATTYTGSGPSANDLIGFETTATPNGAYIYYHNTARTNGVAGNNYIGVPASTPIRLWTLPGLPNPTDNNGILDSQLDNIDIRN